MLPLLPRRAGTLLPLAVAFGLMAGCSEAPSKPAKPTTITPTADATKPDATKPEDGQAEPKKNETADAAKPAEKTPADKPTETATNEKPAEPAANSSVALDAGLPDYTPAVGVSGTLNSVGSDTMNNLMALWQEGFKSYYPAVKTGLEGKGSNTAIKALAEGASLFGPMSRDPKPEENDVFEKKFGYKPTIVATSIDMLAIYVHKDNPIKELTLPQVDAIFSSTRKLGYDKDITTWGDLGLEGEWKDAPISIYGRNSASGTYVYLKEHVLGKGDYKTSVKEMPGSPAVVQAVAADKFAIGYSGIGVRTSDVRPVPLAKKEGAKVFPAEPANGYSGDYPLARPLLLALNKEPNKELDPLPREFLRYVLSKQGQEVVVKDGFLPLTAEMARKVKEQVGLKDD